MERLPEYRADTALTPSRTLASPWSRSIPLLVGVIVIICVLLFVYVEFAAIVRPGMLYGWLGFMGGSVLLQFLAIGAVAIPPLRRRIPKRVRTIMGQLAALTSCAGIAASPWLLMAHADDVLRLLMIVLYMWYIAMVIILNSDVLSVVGAIGVVASMVVFALVYDIAYALPVCAFLTMEGVALVMIRRRLWRAADTLAAALVIMRAERDAKTRFIASASHDLQQPLMAAALYFNEIMGDDVVRGAMQRHDRAVAGVRSALSSTQSLLRSMLEYLRLEADAVQADMRRVQIGPVLADVALQQDGAARMAGLRIVHVPSRLVALADADMLQRTIENIVANAVRHSHGTRIVVGARVVGARVRLWVIDDGRGIAAADRQRLFEDYVQGVASGQGGFGLGLASARRMAGLMSGTIGIDPRWTGGSAFYVDIARAVADNAVKQPALASIAPSAVPHISPSARRLA